MQPYTIYHIKKDGKLLCGGSAKGKQAISITAAGQATLRECCPNCKAIYEESKIRKGISE